MGLKRFAYVLLSCLLLFTTLPTTAFAAKGSYDTKDEVIYGKLDANGHVENIYVVNSFAVNEAGSLTDYGDYRSIRNLTDLSTIEEHNQKIEFEAATDFYYQGELMNEELPWNISITYILDGKEMLPEDLAGESGDLEIQIETSANDAVDETFFNYYMLQIVITFDPVKVTNIQAPEATEANEGKDKRMNFTVLPEQEEVFIVSAQVTNLEMDPIDISAVPANIGFDDPNTDELAEDMKKLADAIGDVHVGVEEISTGVAELSGGAAALYEGSSQFQSGLHELNQSSSELINGSTEILDVFKNMTSSMEDTPETPDVEEIERIPEGLRETAEEIRSLNKGVKALEEAIDAIPDGTVSDEEIEKLKEILEDSDADERLFEVVEELTMNYYAAQRIKHISQEIPVHISEVNHQLANTLDEIADGIEASISDLSFLDEIAELQEGLMTMAHEYENFHNGLIAYTNGVSELATNYVQLHDGTGELAEGIAEVADGVAALEEGTRELRDSTRDLPDEFQSEIDAFMDDFDFSDYEPVSFVSDKNEDIGVVQFVLQTQSIQVEEVEEEPEEEKESKSLWQRFLDLFR